MTYTPAESALAAAARAVLTEQRIAGGVLPIPDTSMIVAFGEREQIARLVQPAPIQSAELAELTTDEARDYLVKFMNEHFTDCTFDRYIRGLISPSGQLAGDFAWQMATALRRLAARPAVATPAQPIAVSAPTDERAAFMDDYRERHDIPDYVLDEMVWQSSLAQTELSGWQAARAAAPVSQPTKSTEGK